MKYENVFWDWNGTIIDDLWAGIESINALLAPRGLKTFATPDDYHAVFCFPVIEYYKKAGFDFSKEPFDKLAVEYIDNYDAICKNCKVFDDVMSAIISLKEAGVRQFILSASEREGLVSWLDEIGILQYFDDVIGNDNIYAEGKAEIAKSWLKNNPDVDVKKSVMVGDTTHDVKVANAMGIDSVLIARGHNSKAQLLETGKPVLENGDGLLLYLTKQL